MLSFQNAGVLPLPRLLRVGRRRVSRPRAPSGRLQLSTASGCETTKWLDLIMSMIGTRRLFARVESLTGSLFREVERALHPRVQAAKRNDRKFDAIERLTSADQQREIERFGYARLSPEQMAHVYDDAPRGLMSADEGAAFRDPAAIERLFESEIRTIAKLKDEDLVRVHDELHGQRRRRAAASPFHRRFAGRSKRQSAISIIDRLIPMTKSAAQNSSQLKFIFYDILAT